jgi:hypothetical protein
MSIASRSRPGGVGPTSAAQDSDGETEGEKRQFGEGDAVDHRPVRVDGVDRTGLMAVWNECPHELLRATNRPTSKGAENPSNSLKGALRTNCPTSLGVPGWRTAIVMQSCVDVLQSKHSTSCGEGR